MATGANRIPNNCPTTVNDWLINRGVSDLLAVVRGPQKSYSHAQTGVEPRNSLSGTLRGTLIHTMKMKRMSAKNNFFHQYAVNNFR
jgi:hypothetical protein